MSFLLAEQNTNIALRYADYGYILENGRVVMDGDGARRSRENEDVKEFYLGFSSARAQELPRREVLPPPQALALKNAVRARFAIFYDRLEIAQPRRRAKPR